MNAETATLHGGPDALGVPVHDFSTNANACGPCPLALAALRRADRRHYPDPAYTALRVRLAVFHGVAPGRIVLAASASEFIVRITAWAAHLGLRHAVLPRHAYGDYARAARVWGLACVPACDGPALHWSCEPSSPLGTVDAGLCRRASAGSLRVLDCAYAPLRLEGQATPPPPAAWQLWSPNKALGLTGVRAAYAVAPDEEQATAVAALAPSWPLGADGVALLEAWVGAQNWLAGTRERLRRWKARQLALCRSLGWDVVPGSLANFFTARPAVADLAAALHALRGQGIKLRDTASFGLPGYVRLGVRPPASQQALRRAWLALPGHGTPSSSPVVPVATSLSSSPS